MTASLRLKARLCCALLMVNLNSLQHRYLQTVNTQKTGKPDLSCSHIGAGLTLKNICSDREFKEEIKKTPTHLSVCSRRSWTLKYHKLKHNI